MSVLVVGISHKSAPVAMLERLALDPESVVMSLITGSECEGARSGRSLAAACCGAACCDAGGFISCAGRVSARLSRDVGAIVATRASGCDGAATGTISIAPTTLRSSPA